MILDDLAQRFAAGFGGPLPLRTVGREAEYPLVDQCGEMGNLAAIWPHLQQDSDLTPKYEGDLLVALEGEKYTFAAEVGRGTVEVITGPCEDLIQIQNDHEEAVERFAAAAAQEGLQLLGYGIQPATSASEQIMTNKHRYGVLLQAIGEGWLSFTTTASDQVHASISRDELVDATNTVNALSAVTLALCANSPVYGGSHTGAICSREQLMGQIDHNLGRHGMPSRSICSIDDHIALLCNLPVLITKDRDMYGLFDGDCLQYLTKSSDSGNSQARLFEQFLLHEHYIWHSARPRSGHGTLEVRAAGQQPWSEHMAASAFGVAMVEGHRPLRALLLEHFSENWWQAMSQYRLQTATLGLDAKEPSAGLLDDVITLCEDALAARGRGEEVLLKPLRHRLNKGKNPGQEALEAFNNGGINALVEHSRIRLEQGLK